LLQSVRRSKVEPRIPTLGPLVVEDVVAREIVDVLRPQRLGSDATSASSAEPAFVDLGVRRAVRASVKGALRVDDGCSTRDLRPARVRWLLVATLPGNADATPYLCSDVAPHLGRVGATARVQIGAGTDSPQVVPILGPSR